MKRAVVWFAVTVAVGLGLSVAGCSSSDGDSQNGTDAGNLSGDVSAGQNNSGENDADSNAGACPGVGESVPDSVPLDKLGCHVSVATCSNVFDCCSKKERRGISNLPTGVLSLDSKQKCIENYKGPLILFVQAVRNAVDSDRAEYKPKKAASCIQNLRSKCTGRKAAFFAGSASPDAFLSQFAQACGKEVITPLVDEGGKCKEPFECKTGRCVKDSPADQTGTCKPYLGEDESCSLGASKPCKNDLFCMQGTCTQRREQGKNCAGALQCKSRYCGMDNTCQPRKSGDDSCGVNAACKSGICLGAGDNSDGKCLPSPLCDGS